MFEVCDTLCRCDINVVFFNDAVQRGFPVFDKKYGQEPRIDARRIDDGLYRKIDDAPACQGIHGNAGISDGFLLHAAAVDGCRRDEVDIFVDKREEVESGFSGGKVQIIGIAPKEVEYVILVVDHHGGREEFFEKMAVHIFHGKVVLRAVFGESYALISRILFGFLAAGSIANIVLTRTESEEGYTLPNVIFAAVSALLVLTWPGDWHWLSNWKVWQWVIGIGGGLVLSAFVAFLAFVLDDTGPEAKHTLTVSILIFTIVNLILVVVIGKEKYDIIAKCIFAFLAVGSLITTFIAFNDMSPILGWLNLVLTVLNGGAFLFLILGSYEVLMNFINPVLEFFKKGKQTA